MKTKIIYISGSEIFDMADIRAAFDEVRLTLNLDKDTVLFGVPVDNDDAGLSQNTDNEVKEEQQIETIEEVKEESNIQIQEAEPEIEQEIVVEPTPKKRGRPRKQVVEVEEEKTKTEEEVEEENKEAEEVEIDEKIIPILSMLSNDENKEEEQTTETSDEEEIVIEENNENIIDEEFENLDEGVDIEDEAEPDIEKLLSAMTPLGEDLSSNVKEETEEPENVDATLEQLATEYVQNQDKIKTNTKSSSRGRFSSLTDILPFKPKKQREPLSGDLFSWGGLAANDEEFSVPGFFTKKTK
jgi:hypothetical protein